MSAAVLTATESAIAELALVLLLGGGSLLGRRVAGRPGSGGSHLCVGGLRSAGSSQARSAIDGGGMVPWVSSHRFGRRVDDRSSLGCLIIPCCGGFEWEQRWASGCPAAGGLDGKIKKKRSKERRVALSTAIEGGEWDVERWEGREGKRRGKVWEDG